MCAGRNKSEHKIHQRGVNVSTKLKTCSPGQAWCNRNCKDVAECFAFFGLTWVIKK